MSKSSQFFLEKIVTHIIKCKSLNDSLKKAQLLGEILSENNIGVYSLIDIETNLSERYITTLDTSCKSELSNEFDKENIFVVTQPYLSGGHTRLMERLSSFLEKKPDLVISRKVHKEVHVRMEEHFDNVFLCTQKEINDETQRIFKIAKILSRYKNIILNIHPDDIHTIIACTLTKKINPNQKVFFVNHADHLFSYGASIADVWFEISTYGMKIDKYRNLVAHKAFLGIPLENTESPNNINCYSTKITDGEIFITSGASYKFNSKNGLSFKEIICFMMKNYPKSTLYVLGCDIVNNPWWLIEKIKFKNRLKLINTVPYQEYLQIAKKASIYIDSYPMPGATTLPEQFFLAKRSLGKISPLQGYSPVELIKRKQTDNVFTATLTTDEVEKIVIKLQIIHSLDAVKKRFNDALYHEKYSENLCSKFIPWSGDINFLKQDKITKFPQSITKINYITAICFLQLGIAAVLFRILTSPVKKLARKILKKSISIIPIYK